jgi:hypothetical protein
VNVTVLEDGKKIEAIGTVKFDDGLEGQNEIMEFVPSERYADIYGPFDKERKLELSFGHRGDRNADEYDEKILTDKMKSARTLCPSLILKCAKVAVVYFS